ncbi:F-box family protein, putative isoform 3 [Hibiscus syriacus]|uniref:F-box family protein, putative isoform 3 n=1 Tax=Hibiscus syriacus TaxID=106335 RepID=A0A6A3AKN9_HIBSY|nr:F-box family protein, putative isoform 3 [Hibiscus syriacus]
MENIGFSLMTSDLLDNILSRLPAKSFASAAAVRKDWNSACSRILSRPKLSSAISFNPVPLDALQELFEKVMSEPIRPHFVMASVGLGSEFDDILQFMVKKFGSRTPIIVVCAKGILGRDARTQEFREVVWTENTDEEITVNTGTELTVGFVPGLKVDVIPLLRRSEAEPPNCSMPMVYKFVRDIKNFTSPVSGSTSPQAIMIGIVQCLRKQSLWARKDVSCDRSNATSNVEQSTDAVALVFARDRSNKAHGIGNIEFHFAASNGSTAIGPKFKVVYRTEKEDYYVTELAARREGEQEILGANMLEVTDDYKIRGLHHPQENVSSALRALKLEWDSTVLMSVLPIGYFPGTRGRNIWHGDMDVQHQLKCNERDPYSTVYVLMSYTPRQP